MPDDERRNVPAEESWAKLHTDAKSHGDYDDYYRLDFIHLNNPGH